MERIASFQVDHNKLTPGMYLSRRDGAVTTLDLRFKKPNTGDLLTNAEMHSVEHIIATLLRNGRAKDAIVYFGPMGCQTGFYLLVRDADNAAVLSEVCATLRRILEHEGPVFGGTRKECGNYANLDLSLAKTEARRYLAELDARPVTFIYEE